MRLATIAVPFLSGALLLASGPAQAATVEVLHWWTSNGEKNALNVLKTTLEKQNVPWRDFAVPGGGGDTAMTVLQARAIAGNPPEMAQIEGQSIKTWAKLGFLSNLDEVAKLHQWREKLPDIAIEVNTYQNRFVAAPVNIHRVNWLWSNKSVFNKLELTPPKTWPEFFPVADILKHHDIIPLAIGNEKWQVSMLFENMALGIGGADYYRSLFIDMKRSAIKSPSTLKLLKYFKKARNYIGQDDKSLSWNQATMLVADGRAGMQLLGDWVKGELVASNKIPKVDFDCTPAPGTNNTFIYNMDSFVLFKLRSEASERLAMQLADTLMTAEFQTLFNQQKGSIPVLRDVDMSPFDQCAQEANKQFIYAQENDTLLPSMSDSMAVSPQRQEVLQDLVYQYFNDDGMAESDVIDKLLQISKSTDF